MASTATAFNDMAPAPRVTIDIDDADLDPACVTATILQTSKWGQVPVNRSPRAVAGGLVATDYEVPPGVPVIYRVMQHDAAGADIGLTLSLPAQVDVPFGKILISDPLAPADAVMLDGEVTFAGELTRSRATQTYLAGGRTFAMSALQSAFQRVNLSCLTDTVDDRDALNRILEQPVVLFRAHPSTRLPGSFYATIPEVIEDAAGIARGVVDTARHKLTGDEITRPSIDVVVGIYTYDLFKQYLDEKYPPFGTYDDAAAEWATYVNAIRNPPPLI